MNPERLAELLEYAIRGALGPVVERVKALDDRRVPELEAKLRALEDRLRVVESSRAGLRMAK